MSLTADEMTRLRRLMAALGIDGSMNASDEYVRGILFTVLGQAAGKIEKMPAHGHREDYYLLANGRRLAEKPIAEVKSMPNWVLATELFATGSTSARKICIDAGIDPDGCKVVRS